MSRVAFEVVYMTVLMLYSPILEFRVMGMVFKTTILDHSIAAMEVAMYEVLQID